MLWIAGVSVLAFPGTPTGPGIPSPDLTDSLLFFGSITIASVGYGVLLFSKTQPTKLELAALTSLGVLLAATGNTPWFDNDVYRYQWAGCGYNEEVDPTQTSPKEFTSKALTPNSASFIGYRDVASIYPPFVQWIHAGLAKVSCTPAIYISFYSFICWLTLILFIFLVKDKRLATFLTLNPVFLKEFADSAHFDIMAIFFMTLAFSVQSFTNKNRWFLQASLVGLAACIRPWYLIFPLLITPKQGMRQSIVAAVILTASFLIYFNDASQFKFYLSNLGYFSTYWIFNPGPLLVINQFFSGDTSSWPQAGFICRALGVIILLFAGLTKRDTANPNSPALLFLLFLAFQPNFNPWYLFSVYPLLVVGNADIPAQKLLSWLSTIGIAGYSFWIHNDPNHWIFKAAWFSLIFLFCLKTVSRTQQYRQNRESLRHS